MFYVRSVTASSCFIESDFLYSVQVKHIVGGDELAYLTTRARDVQNLDREGAPVQAGAVHKVVTTVIAGVAHAPLPRRRRALE